MPHSGALLCTRQMKLLCASLVLGNSRHEEQIKKCQKIARTWMTVSSFRGCSDFADA